MEAILFYCTAGHETFKRLKVGPQTQKVKKHCFRPSVPNLGYAYPLGIHNQLGKIPKINGNGKHFDVTLYKAVV